MDHAFEQLQLATGSVHDDEENACCLAH
jgi:hypothetical protein